MVKCIDEASLGGLSISPSTINTRKELVYSCFYMMKWSQIQSTGFPFAASNLLPIYDKNSQVVITQDRMRTEQALVMAQTYELVKLHDRALSMYKDLLQLLDGPEGKPTPPAVIPYWRKALSYLYQSFTDPPSSIQFFEQGVAVIKGMIMAGYEIAGANLLGVQCQLAKFYNEVGNKGSVMQVSPPYVLERCICHSDLGACNASPGSHSR